MVESRDWFLFVIYAFEATSYSFFCQWLLGEKEREKLRGNWVKGEARENE